MPALYYSTQVSYLGLLGKLGTTGDTADTIPPDNQLWRTCPSPAHVLFLKVAQAPKVSVYVSTPS